MAMFIDTIEERYPDRVILNLDVAHSGFRVIFELPNEHRLRVHIDAFPNDEGMVYEVIQETSSNRYHLSQADHYPITVDEASIPLLLKKYLKVVIGNLEEHTYEHSFIELLLTSFLREQGNNHE